MTLLSLRLRAVVGLLALTLLGSISQSHAGTSASASELTVTSATPAHITLLVGSNIIPTTPGTITPGLFGSVNDLIIKATKTGATRAKATVGLLNSSGTSLRNVTATIYLSNDNTLSTDDLQIKQIKLSDYVAKGKIGKYKTLSLPFNYKVPSVLDSYLNGKYLIVVLSADNLGTLTTNPVVVGPITLP